VQFPAGKPLAASAFRSSRVTPHLASQALAAVLAARLTQEKLALPEGQKYHFF